MVLPVIKPRWLEGAALASLRAVYRGSSRLLFLPGAVDDALAAELREALAPVLQPYWIADRGRYARGDAMPLAELIEPVGVLVATVTGESLRLASAQWQRFTPGSYALHKDSAGAGERSVEATLDFSAAAFPNAGFTYRRGADTMPFTQEPLSLALVDRRPAAVRYDRYLPLSGAPAEVWRLRAAFISDA